MTRAVRWAVVALLACGAVVTASAAKAQTAPADTAVAVVDSVGAAAAADTSAAAPTSPAMQGIAGQGSPASEQAQPLILNWTHKPRAGLTAEVRLWRYFLNWDDNLAMRAGSSATTRLGYAVDTYRRQKKEIETRDLSLNYGSGTLLPFRFSAGGSWNRREDRTINTAGLKNINKRDNRTAQASAVKDDITTGFLLHSLSLRGSLRNQIGENQNQRDDFLEGDLDGAWRMRFGLFEGVRMATSVYGKRIKGEQMLGNEEGPTSAQQDSIAAGIFYQRRRVSGHVVVRRGDYARHFLDYRRNANAQIDTLNLPAGVSTIVDETERKESTVIEWRNQLRLGNLAFNSVLARDAGLQHFDQSGVGTRDRYDERVDLTLTYAAGRDSFAIGYDYGWKWDNQQQKGATEPRGKKYNKQRNASFDWIRQLFTHTQLFTKFQQGLTQDDAENQFDQNDRDRVETNFSVRTDTNWRSFRTSLLFSFKEAVDNNLRATRSANNNTRDTYEVSPGYTWPVADWLELRQTFRVFIQYTDYEFDGYEGVRKQDNYNKRGNLMTQLTVEPSQRLRITVRHDFNQRFNATKTRTDASGGVYYRTDQEQTIGKIDLGFTFKADDWLTLEGATGRSKDVKDTIGLNDQVTTRETFAGDIWLGVGVRKRWGRQNTWDVNATVRDNHAYGPNVTESNRHYWDADVSVSYAF